MEKNKAQELVNLTKNFCEQVKNLMNGEEDCGLILSLHVEHPHDTDDTKHENHNIIGVCGRGADVMFAVHKLDEETHILNRYGAR